MILITGANGQTGRAIIKALISRGEQVKALVHKPEQIPGIKALGVNNIVAGDMLDQTAVNEAIIGVNTIYHICSALNPQELQIGERIINAAISTNVKYFVYHSVLHSILTDMPHHQKKLMVEKILVDSGIPYAIVQPAVLMQNIQESWKLLAEKGIFQQKFFTSEDTRLCMVDLDDIAEAASIILTNPCYAGATYELCGPDNLSLTNMLSAMKLHLGHEITVETPSDEIFATQLKTHGIGDYQVNTLLKMFNHYNNHSFIGNSNVLKWILERKPNSFSTFIHRLIQSKKVE